MLLSQACETVGHFERKIESGEQSGVRWWQGPLQAVLHFVRHHGQALIALGWTAWWGHPQGMSP